MEINITNSIFEQKFNITLYSGMTFFVGPNGSGKTQALKAISKSMGDKKVRYLSSNRIADMEQYRSKTNQYSYTPDKYNVGGTEKKMVRLQIETASGDFFTMDERKDVYIKVSARLSILFGRQIYLKWNEGNLQVYFEKVGTKKEYSVALEASGLVNLVSILAALFDDEVEVLLIDEPEVSLHPQMQSYLLREMLESAEKGKTIIISTHSTDMLSFKHVKDFSNLVFFTEGNYPIQISPDADELKNKRLQEFLLRMGQIYKKGFFAQKVLLIEGASDMIICHFLENKLGLNVDVAGSQIIPVDGKGQFPVVVKLFSLIKKDVAILTDLDGFIDNNDIINLFANLPKAIQLANNNGNRNLLDIVKQIKEDLSKLLTQKENDVKDLYESHPYWKNKNKHNGDKENNIENIKRRSIVGKMFLCTDIEVKSWPSYEEWISIKQRLESIFSQFEKIGCFILRKGALESYYKFASNETYEEKPSEAVLEVENIRDKDIGFIHKNYGDIIKAIEYISLSKEINESIIIKEELISELSIAICVIRNNNNASEEDIYASIKRIKGERKSLFQFIIIKEKQDIKIKVDIKTKILNVNGFPLEVSINDNINILLDKVIY